MKRYLLTYNENWGEYDYLEELLAEMDTLKNPQFFKIYDEGRNITEEILAEYYSYPE